MKNKRVWFFILVAGLSLSSQAKSLNWQEFVQLAIKSNVDLQAAQQSVEAAHFQVSSNQSGYYPQLSLNWSSEKRQDTKTITTPGQSSSLTSTTTSHAGTLSASENIFSGFQTWASVDQAKANEEVSRANLVAVKAKLSSDLKGAFVNLVYSQNNLKLSEEIIQRRKDNLKMVELQFENGNENKGSLLLSKAYLKQADFEYLQAQNNLRLSQQKILQVLGMDSSSEVLEVSGDVPLVEPPQNLNLISLVAQTTDHLQAIAQEDSAKAGVRLAQASFFPNINLVGSAGRSGDSVFPKDPMWSVGLNFSLPLFSGGKDYYSMRSAESTHSSAMYNRISVDLGLLPKLQQSYSGYLEAVEKLKVDQSFLDAAIVREKIAKAKYDNSLLTFEQWDLIESDLIFRQKTVLQSYKDRVVSEASWEQSQGKGVIP